MIDDDDDWAIRTIIGEAASEPDIGKVGVAHVIQNRVKDGSYGKSVQDVILAPSQFTPWNSVPSVRRLMSIPTTHPTYQKAAMAWRAAKNGDVPDFTGGALNFANPGASDPVNQRGWISDMMKSGTAMRVGNHVFGTAPGRPGARAEARTAKPSSSFELLDDGPAPAKTSP